MPRSCATRLRQSLAARLPVSAALLLAICWLVFGFLPSRLQFTGSQASAANVANVANAAQSSARALSLDERVRYQRAVEEVYWRHTIWPTQNAQPKPTLDQVVSLDVTRARVSDVLRKSDALARQWQRPVTAQQLQDEVKRMARETRQPTMLRELWQALDNDALVIAEVLARPALVERLARTYYATDENFHGAVRTRVEAQLRGQKTLEELRRQGDGKFSEVEAVKVARKTPREVSTTDNPTAAAATAASGKGAAVELTAAEWEAETARLRQIFAAETCETCGKGATLPLGDVSSLQEDERSFYVTSVVSSGNKRLKVARVEWEKKSFDSWWSEAQSNFATSEAQSKFASNGGSEGFDYQLAEINQLADDTWTPTKALPVTTGTAVWTGTEMIIWGGSTNSGARYNPSINTWTPTAAVGAPQRRRSHTAVWTGTEMIVWGGCGPSFDFCGLSDGGRYDPATDTWKPTNTSGAASPRSSHAAVWTGAKMIVWGGCHHGYNNRCTPLNTGGIYDPASDSWTPMSSNGAPSPRNGHAAVWTGAEMIVWGPSNTGGRYNLASNTWTPTNTLNAPSGERYGFTAVWTGSEMIIWGGYESNFVTLNTGGRYNPANDTWTPTSTTNAPAPRFAHTAVWTGTEMIVYGGDLRSTVYSVAETDTGGRYNPQTDTWTPTSTVNAPPKAGHVAVWTGTEMIVWSISHLKSGGRYNPQSDSWTATSTVNAPTARYIVNGVWTGTEMFVWGGIDTSGANVNTGGRYNPQSDSWTPTSVTNAPTGRRFHTTIWTGEEVIVWGGTNADWGNGAGLLNTGGRYNPSTDSWTATSMAGVPSPRNLHTAVWTGSHMIIWGGLAQGPLYVRGVHTGARYNVAADAWTPVSTHRAPSARYSHLAFWTGTGMLVWGGTAEEGAASHGGYYSAPGAANNNTPPSVRITAPADNSTAESGATIEITTETSDPDGAVSTVYFYVNDTFLGSDSTAPFNFSWPEARGGSYTIKAVAKDDSGGVTTSAPVRVSVNPSTAPPSCVLNTPVNGATYTTP